MLKIGFIIILLGFISYALVWGIIRISLKRSLLNYPNERSLHNVPTPRLGGLAIVFTWYLGIVIFYYFEFIEANLFYALLCGSLLAVVSFIDDLIEIKASIRLIIHFIVAMAAFYFLGGMRPFINPEIAADYYYFTYPIVIIGMVWFINLYNFMDGINGFVSIETITIALFMFFFTLNPVNLILIAAVAGFFYWNWPNAKIFMGDVGSTQLGFILVVLGIYFHNTYEFSIVNWIMLSAPFWFDATFTLYRRWRNHEKLSEAHNKHVYQRLVRAGYTHKQVGQMLIVINVVIILMILFYRYFRNVPIQLITYFISLCFLYYITRWVDKKVPFK
ncbi:MAG: glycosyltransferase family 4 protein [Bacteroidales bacterium]